MWQLWDDELFLEESDISASNYFVSCLLSTRSNALAMCSIAHLGYLKELDAKVLGSYTKRYPTESSQRAPNQKELISADHAIWTEMFRLARLPDWSVDRAIDEVLRNGFADRELAGRPTVPKATLDALASGKASNSRNQVQKKLNLGNNGGNVVSTDNQIKGKGKGGKKGKGNGDGKGQLRYESKGHQHEICDGPVNGKCRCSRLNTAQIGGANTKSPYGHVCPVKMPNGRPCGGYHPLFRQTQAVGSRT